MDTPCVVVGIDFSEPSGRAVREARSFAAAVGATLEAVHVRTVASGPDTGAFGAEQRAWLEALDLSAQAVRTRRGTPWVELARHAAERDAEMIVVGTHGWGGFQPVSLGSTTARLTMTCTRPVLVVGRRSRPRAGRLLAV